MENKGKNQSTYNPDLNILAIYSASEQVKINLSKNNNGNNQR